ncbi:MAG: hypothetical protein HC921_02625 [Synechococcaceae cyanobacterium SM2_3_1]|nr:hypothetical protein [Synechococcaceae cyanobacterium SM2_3_1]
MATAVADFTGTWHLDNEASDSFDEIMKAEGLNMIARNFAARLKVTQEIVQSDSHLTITARTKWGAHTTDASLNGETEIKTNRQGKEYRACHYWDPDGTTLITKVESTHPDGRPIETIVRRFLEDGNATMVQQVELRYSTGEIYSARRIFRRG